MAQNIKPALLKLIMKKKQRKELEELAKNPQGGIIMALKERGKKFEFKKGGSVTNEDINDLIKQFKELKS